MHKFTVGQRVNLASPDLQSPSQNNFVIIRLLINGDADPRYRIKCNAENFERVVYESELTLV